MTSVFFGGGTPSLFGTASIADILSQLDRAFGLTPDCEVSLEANPDELADSATASEDLRSAGITRLSIGVQSFQAEALAVLGRSHDVETLETAIDRSMRAGFESVSCDLIFAVPGQDLARWSDDLRRANAAGFDHISTYNLTYETGTPMTGLRNAGRITAVEDSVEQAHYEHALAYMEDEGFEQYEVSSFAKPGKRCRHNRTYWQWRDYLGIGAGAHGFTRGSHAVGDFGRRYENLRQPAHYMSAADGNWQAWQETIDLDAAVKEIMFTGLRRIEGVDLEMLNEVLGPDALSHYPRASELEKAGLLEIDERHVCLTREGLLVADSVVESLVA